MALLDQPAVAWLADLAEERLGIALRPADQVRRLEEMQGEFAALASDAEDLALHSLDYFTGRPSELTTERRRRIAQRSRVALKFDPLAGAEAGLLADFAFGKGVPVPTARDPKVQDVIDEAWSDANNEEKLTGFMAQRRLSNELLTSGELFITLYVEGGRVRVGRLDPDTVEAVVPDPEDRLRPLWYMARQRRFEWDFTQDRPAYEDEVTRDGISKFMYWKHWRNYDDAVSERQAAGSTDGEVPLRTPPPEKIAKGLVFHVAINQTGEELRGNPPWARSLRFFTAMNVLTEAHVVMAQGASSFIARRVVKGGPRQVTKAAASVLGQVSELGAGLRREQIQGETPPAFAPGAPPPMPPGSWWTENQSSELTPLSLQSGAGQMVQTAQIVRAPIAAAAGFGQHYLGDASNANLATASTLELPANMRVESWQEYSAQMFRWFTDRAIEAAVKAGRLGGLDGFSDEGPLGEMRLHEAEDRAAMERRTGTDLSYEFQMPFPGRRQLPDVAGAVQVVGNSFDPNGMNKPLRRILLRFFLENTGAAADVARAVEECVPDEPFVGGIGYSAPQQPGVPGVAPGAAAGTPPAGATPPEGETLPNVRRQSTPPGEAPASEQAWIPPELRQAVDELEREVTDRFQRTVRDPAIEALLKLEAPAAAAATTNGAAG